MGALFGAAAEMTGGVVNTLLGKYLQEEATQRNYYLNEKAAVNAMHRTEQLYNNIYSPGALLKQYQEAGLSPSLMYGTSAGGGGNSATMGNGANGISAMYSPIDLAGAAAQMKLAEAQANNLNADTNLKEKEGILKDIQNEYQRLFTDIFNIDATLQTSFITDDDGIKTSLYELAGKFQDYDKFAEKIRKLAESDQFLYDTYSTEKGQEFLRGVWLARKKMARDIATLHEESVDAMFKVGVMNALKKVDFANQNAAAIISSLKAEVDTNELTQAQKEAWLNLLNKMEDGTAKDIVIALGMILGQFLNSGSATAITKAIVK